MRKIYIASETESGVLVTYSTHPHKGKRSFDSKVFDSLTYLFTIPVLILGTGGLRFWSRKR